MTKGKTLALGCAVLVAFAACMPRHSAPIQTAKLPPLPAQAVRHSDRLWIDLPPEMAAARCVDYEGYQKLCFEGLREGLARSLRHLLWPSFPDVRVREHGDQLTQGDYLLQIEADIDALPPDPERPGWSAALQGRWRLVRDGMPLKSETVATRSRGDFAYGSSLGIAGGEVVDALSAHIASVLIQLPESERTAPVLLPPVAAEDALRPEAAPPSRAAPASEAAPRPSDSARADKAPKQPTAPTQAKGDAP